MQFSLETIYRDNRQALFTLALAITRCEATAEDSIQQAFLKLGSKFSEISSDPVPYVFRSVRNAAIDHRRRIERQNRVQESVFNGYVPPPVPLAEKPDATTLTAERDQILRAAIEELDDVPRQVVLLKSFSDLTYRQIAVALEIPEKTAATHYRRSLISLSEKLKGQL